MEDRVGKFVAIVVDSDGKWDLYRDIRFLKETKLFDSIEEAERTLSSEGSTKYLILKAERDHL